MAFPLALVWHACKTGALLRAKTTIHAEVQRMERRAR